MTSHHGNSLVSSCCLIGGHPCSHSALWKYTVMAALEVVACLDARSFFWPPYTSLLESSSQFLAWPPLFISHAIYHHGNTNGMSHMQRGLYHSIESVFEWQRMIQLSVTNWCVLLVSDKQTHSYCIFIVVIKQRHYWTLRSLTETVTCSTCNTCISVYGLLSGEHWMYVIGTVVCGWGWD